MVTDGSQAIAISGILHWTRIETTALEGVFISGFYLRERRDELFGTTAANLGGYIGDTLFQIRFADPAIKDSLGLLLSLLAKFDETPQPLALVEFPVRLGSEVAILLV